MSRIRILDEDRPRVRIVEMEFDLGSAHPDHVVEILTENGSRYRLMRSTGTIVGAHIITGVKISTTNARMVEAVKKSTDVDRMVHIGRRFYFGGAFKGRARRGETIQIADGLHNHTSPVEAVYVGGRKVAG